MSRYRELAEALRARIGSEFQVGDRLPPISALQREYEIPGLNTVRDALKILSREGLVSTEHGRGSFVVGVPSPRPAEAADVLVRLGVGAVQREVIVRRAGEADLSVEDYLRRLVDAHADAPTTSEVLARAGRRADRATRSAVDALADERISRGEP